MTDRTLGAREASVVCGPGPVTMNHSGRDASPRRPPGRLPLPVALAARPYPATVQEKLTAPPAA